MNTPVIKQWEDDVLKVEDDLVVISSDEESSKKKTNQMTQSTSKNTNELNGYKPTEKNDKNNNANAKKKIKLKRKRHIDMTVAPDFISLRSDSNDDEEIEVQPKRQKFTTEKKSPSSDTTANIPLTPKEVARLCESDALSMQIKMLFEKCRQREKDLKSKLLLQEALENAVQRTRIGDRGTRVYLVGSSSNGFGCSKSDADYCIVVDHSKEKLQRAPLIRMLRDIKRLLMQAKFARGLQVIPAKVPILKFSDKLSGMDCDININNLVGIKNTQLMLAYSRLDPRVKPLAMCVKLWARHNNINDASQGTLSSYSLLLMTIFYLQVGIFPAILPSLQLRHPHYFNPFDSLDQFKQNMEKIESVWSENKASLFDLFKGFFSYYSNFNYNDRIMSVRLSSSIMLQRSIHHESFLKKGILIEEPFERTNVARAVYSESHAIRIKLLIRDTCTAIKKCKNLQEIIPIAPKQQSNNDDIICIDT